MRKSDLYIAICTIFGLIVNRYIRSRIYAALSDPGAQPDQRALEARPN
jgi:hypothetical protein